MLVDSSFPEYDDLKLRSHQRSKVRSNYDQKSRILFFILICSLEIGTMSFSKYTLMKIALQLAVISYEDRLNARPPCSSPTVGQRSGSLVNRRQGWQIFTWPDRTAYCECSRWITSKRFWPVPESTRSLSYNTKQKWINECCLLRKQRNV